MRSLLRRLRGASAEFLREPEEPIRAELFSIERLEQHAESLAAAQRVTARPAAAAGRSRARLRDNGRVLLAAYRAHRRGDPRGARDHAGRRVAGRQLPRRRGADPRDPRRSAARLLSPAARSSRTGRSQGYPRVFGLAWAFVAHTDSRFDPQTLRRFVRAYQRVQPLTIGELWAVAITLRIVLVENLRRVGRADREQPGRAPGGRRRSPTGCSASASREAEPADVVAAALRARRRCRRAFAVQLVQRLRDQDPAVTPALRWLDERLAAQGTTADEIVREEHQRQGAMNVTVRNVITSMRLHVRRRLGGVLRERQPRRRGAARRAATSPRWTSRRAIATGTRSKSSRAARGTRSSRSPGARSRPRERAGAAPSERRRRDAAPRAGSRLLPDRERPPGASRRELGFRVPLRAAGSSRADRARGHRRLSRSDRGRHRADPRAAARSRGRDAGRRRIDAARCSRCSRSSRPRMRPSRW